MNFGPRSRKYWIQYGGEFAGTLNGTQKFVPAYTGLHLCNDEVHPGPPYRVGGPLFVTKKKVYIQRFESNSMHYTSVPTASYDGKLVVIPYIPSPEPSPLNLSGWGAKGWARTQPLHPIYNLGVSIGELKDLPGMVSQTARGLKALASRSGPFTGVKTVGDFLRSAGSKARTSGDAYLYGAFGVWPMLQDLLFLYEMRKKLNQKLRWLHNHNGKSIRRKVELDAGEFTENIARSQAPSSQFSPVLSSTLYAPNQNVVVNNPALKSYKRQIWYTAKYRFYIPEIVPSMFEGSPSDGLSLDLLGLSADPSILYKLIPWSWLLDWFTSVGAAMSNIITRVRAQVVAEYAYVMCEEHFEYASPGTVLVREGVSNGGPWSLPDRRLSGVSRTIYEFRQREVANPYGFGITFGSLSAYQWSILVALGLSRGGKHSAPRP